MFNYFFIKLSLTWSAGGWVTIVDNYSVKTISFELNGFQAPPDQLPASANLPWTERPLLWLDFINLYCHRHCKSPHLLYLMPFA
jgi:hypothetical protein